MRTGELLLIISGCSVILASVTYAQITQLSTTPRDNFVTQEPNATCMSAGTVRVSKTTKIFGHVNSLNCSCTQANKQACDLLVPPIADAYIPICNPDGSWKCKQWYFKGAWCVDENGNQITKTQPSQIESSLICC